MQWRQPRVQVQDLHDLPSWIAELRQEIAREIATQG